MSDASDRLWADNLSVGQIFEFGTHHVSEDELLDFARAWDPQDFHVDKAVAERGPYGGLIASGPTGADRSPVPWAPPGLHLTGLEGAGEVQTPLTGHPAAMLRIGDLVWFRHAKSGELFEHVRDVHLVRGETVTEVVPSYRGCDRAF